MIKSYLIMEKGLVDEAAFPLDPQVSIGRDKENDIHLSDLAVSRRHALVYLAEGQAVVEDLGSSNGTYLNGEKISKAVVRSGDILRIGSVTIRFLQQSEDIQEIDGLTTQKLSQSGVFKDEVVGKLTRQSPRVLEAIAKVPLFANLREEWLTQVSQAAQVLVFEPGRVIIRQGDRGRSLYIILDGKVKVFTYDNQGKEIPLNYLSDNQFFGEISFLKGMPRSATVQAIEETLACKLSNEAMRQIVQKSPAVKGMLEENYLERLKDLEAKKREVGVLERRKHPRYNIKLSINFSISSTALVSNDLRKKIFQAPSKDISISGIRLGAQDRSLLQLPTGCLLRIEISLPQPWGPIRCLGILRSLVAGKGGEDSVSLGVEFTEMPPANRKKLEQFLTS
jgi:CRP-like cAMP-binding protein